MAKWLWKQCWDFSALDSPAKYRSVSRRVVKFAIPHYLFGAIATPKERLWGRNLKAYCVHNFKHWE